MLYKFEELKNITEKGAKDVNNLLQQLVHDQTTYKPISLEKIERILTDCNVVIVCAKDREKIIGIGFLYIILKPRGHYAYLEDMMVDKDYRRQGIGEGIARRLIESAKKRGVSTIELTARPSRTAANALYQKLGFEPKDTNVYRLKLSND